MTRTLVMEPKPCGYITLTPGVGPDAETLNGLWNECHKSFFDNQSIGEPRRAALDTLYQVFDETCKSGWDGYDALPVSYEAYRQAERFLMAFPANLPLPEISVEPDGEISLEWHAGPRRVFSVSVGAGEELTYAGLFGASKTHGVELFYGEIPRLLLENIRRLSA